MMTPEEKKEFTALKHTRCEQGFFTPQQQERWNYLHKLQAQQVMKLINIVEEQRLMRLN